jgi:hypothetical protein
MTEAERIAESTGTPETWRLWGPYLAERAWGTVREDYSADGNAWEYFPHDHARSRAYRWSEDGIGGISDIRQRLCFALTLWNGRDPILKERLFGLSGPEGNHGEDVKEVYFHADATPSHSYLKFVYLYPQRPFPYARLVEENAQRDALAPEFELTDTDAFDDNRFFTVTIEYAKAAIDDLCIRITARNDGPDEERLILIPTLWFRNTWSWQPRSPRPELRTMPIERSDAREIEARHAELGTYHLLMACDGHTPQLLFTENETNCERLFGAKNASPFVKDGIERAVIHIERDAVNGEHVGTKVGLVTRTTLPAGATATLRLRLVHEDHVPTEPFDATFEATFADRIAEADAFYDALAPAVLTDGERAVQRQAYAGLIWSKQFYHYDVARWLDGDPGQPTPAPKRADGRNAAWRTADMRDVLSMPDPWEYPWFAAWDLAFHTIPFAQIDPDFAKHQLLLLCREWYMHPNGQLPAYEWNFGDVNPPVHAWAALRVYKIERKLRGKDRDEPGDTDFLERIFHKLLLNFTWWVNRKDAQGNNIFEGGFLGLDNIGIFDRSAPLPTGGYIEQCDGTAWMAMFSLNMLAIALELTRVNPAYEDVAVKFAEHFVYIAHALNHMGDCGLTLWDDADGFYYDVLRLPDGTDTPLRLRSLVGLIPLLAVEVFDASVLDRAPRFTESLSWFVRHKPDLCREVAHLGTQGQERRAIFSLVGTNRLRRVLTRVLDPEEFLSPYGVRSLSREHRDRPFVLQGQGKEWAVGYEPAESRSRLFGGNSNWRGPVWFPINYLLIEALQKFDYAYGARFQIACPTGSGRTTDLWGVGQELADRLIAVFRQDSHGRRPCFGDVALLQQQSLLQFHEYFHGDSGAGLGASHQTGWTALVAKLLAQRGS